MTDKRPANLKLVLITAVVTFCLSWYHFDRKNVSQTAVLRHQEEELKEGAKEATLAYEAQVFELKAQLESSNTHIAELKRKVDDMEAGLTSERTEKQRFETELLEARSRAEQAGSGQAGEVEELKKKVAELEAKLAEAEKAAQTSGQPDESHEHEGVGRQEQGAQPDESQAAGSEQSAQPASTQDQEPQQHGATSEGEQNEAASSDGQQQEAAPSEGQQQSESEQQAAPSEGQQDHQATPAAEEDQHRQPDASEGHDQPGTNEGQDQQPAGEAEQQPSESGSGDGQAEQPAAGTAEQPSAAALAEGAEADGKPAADAGEEKDMPTVDESSHEGATAAE